MLCADNRNIALSLLWAMFVVSERLCSHQYLDFRIHPFFSGVEWRKLSTTDNLKVR